MILTNFKTLEMYKGMSKRLDIAIDYILKTDASQLEPGKYPIDGDNVFAIINQGMTGTYDEKKFESHKRYLDIQTVISGDERIFIAQTNDLAILTPYQDDSDIMFYQDAPEDAIVHIQPKLALILYPEDAHKVSVATDSPKSVKKMIVKVKI